MPANQPENREIPEGGKALLAPSRMSRKSAMFRFRSLLGKLRGTIWQSIIRYKPNSSRSDTQLYGIAKTSMRLIRVMRVQRTMQKRAIVMRDNARLHMLWKYRNYVRRPRLLKIHDAPTWMPARLRRIYRFLQILTHLCTTTFTPYS
jgi:hypothetical protein